MEKTDLEEIASVVRKIVKDNKKFLDQVMDEDFEPEIENEGESTEVFEEL